jgi:hypothetical protein
MGRGKGDGKGGVSIWPKFFILMYENRTMTPTEIVLGKGRGDWGKDRGSEFGQGMLYACMEVSR